MISDPMWSMVSGPYGTVSKSSLIVFANDRFQGFPAKSRLHLKSSKDGWELHGSSWLFFPRVVALPKTNFELNFSEGMLVNTIRVNNTADGSQEKLLFSRRFRGQAEALSREYGLAYAESAESMTKGKTMEADLAM